MRYRKQTLKERNMHGFQVLILLSTTLALAVGEDFKRVCYFTNWSNKRPVKAAQFNVSDIDPFICTHLIYAFAGIDIPSKRLKKIEYDDDNGSLTDKQGRYFEFTGLKRKNRNLKTLLSVGGQTLSKDFPAILDSAESINLFAQNCRIYLVDRNFDGLDVDWEYPGKIYKNKFTELLKALRKEFDEYAKSKNIAPMLISIATAPGGEEIDNSYNIPEIVKYVDFINVMSYDYFGPWSTVTGFNGPLYSRLSDPAFNPTYSQNWTIHRYIELGAPKQKLVLGMNGNAVSFTLNSTETNVGSPVKEAGNKGHLILDPGHLSYPEVCMMLEYAKKEWDEEQAQNYAYFGDQWVGFNDPRSIQDKIQFANATKIGGVMFWSLDLDDYKGKYCQQGKYPLLSAVKRLTDEKDGKTDSPVGDDKTTPDPDLSGDFRVYVVDNGTDSQYNVRWTVFVLTVLAVVISSVMCRC